jgi:hypothetical protein
MKYMYSRRQNVLGIVCLLLNISLTLHKEFWPNTSLVILCASILGDCVLVLLEHLWSYSSQENFTTWPDCDRAKQLMQSLLDTAVRLSSSSSPSAASVKALRQFVSSARELLGPQLTHHLLGRTILQQLLEVPQPDRARWGLLFPVGLVGAVVEGWGSSEQLLAQGLDMAASDEAIRSTVDTAIRYV